MQYNPRLSAKEIRENHRHFSGRVSLYRKRGLDFSKSREFILKKAGPLKGAILEIGTGTGHTALALARAGYKVISIDSDKEALKVAALNLAHAKLLSRVKFYAMDGRSMDFEDGSFGNIVCVNLFHHIKRANKMFSEIDRVLCADGKVVFADFNKKGAGIVNAVHNEEGRLHEDEDVTKDSVRAYFSGFGYEIRGYGDRCHWVLVGKKSIER